MKTIGLLGGMSWESSLGYYRAIDIPLLHIADATANVIVNKGLSTVGLLGTAFTMEQDFYKHRLIDSFGIKVLTPNEQDRALVHKVIYQELCLGKVNTASKKEYLRIIQAMAGKGAQAVILGCTEIGLLVQQADTPVILLDTTVIHAKKASEFAINDER